MDAIRLGIIKVNLDGEPAEVNPNGGTEAEKVNRIRMTRLSDVKKNTPEKAKQYKETQRKMEETAKKTSSVE